MICLGACDSIVESRRSLKEVLMKSVHWRSTAACCYTIGLTISAVGTGCLGDGNLHDGEDSVSSAIVLDTTSSYAFVGVQSGKCLQPVNQSTASNARVEISTCT